MSTSALGLLVLVSMILAGCGQATPTEAPGAVPATAEGPAPTEVPAEPKIATGAWSQEPDNVVPYYTQMSYAWWIAQLTLVGLAEWDDKGNYVPELAAEIPSVENGGVSADGLTITWKLKEGLLWSDGEPLTSADVKFTWESVVDEGNAALTRGSYSHIDSVETPDDTTVVLKFKEVYPPWQVLFAGGPNTAGSILPKHILEGHTALETDPFIHWPTVASGPFVISEWVAGDHMTFVRNDNFYGSRPKLDQIFIRFVPTPETALAALQTGDVDWYPDFSESDISTLAALEPAVHLLVVPGSEFEHYLFNMGVKAGVVGADGAVIPGSQSPEDGFCPFKDYKVRKAIILGIDRQAIVDALLEGKTTVAATQWPNSFWENSSLTAETYDPEQAKALLEEAGYTDADGDGIREGTCDGQPVKLEFTFQTTDKQIRVDIALAAQSDLSKIGIKFNPIHMPAGTFFGTYTDGGPMSTGKFDMAGYTTGFYPDPYPVTEDWLCRSIPNAENPGGANWYQYCSPELDALFAGLNSSADPAARKVAVDAIQKHIYDNALVVMMYTRANVYGYVDRFVPGPFSFTSNMNWNAEVWDVK